MNIDPVISIVTGTRNRPNDFRRLVDSIEAGTTIEWELVVSDASDSPLELEDVATDETWPRIRIIPERPRLGCTKGYNVAFRAARGEFVLWANDDAILEHGCADNAVQFMRDHPEIGMGAIPYAEPRRPRYQVNSYFGMIYGNFGIVRRECGEQVGWFDEEFPMYGNDNSFAFRVLLAGKGILEVPNARMFHFATDDAHRAENNNQAQRIRDVERLVEKYGPHMAEMRATYKRCGGPLFGHEQSPDWARQAV